MKRIITFFICLFFPSKLKPLFLRLFGNKIGKNVSIGISLIYTNELRIASNSRIGNFNLIYKTSIMMEEFSSIGNFNMLNGPYLLNLRQKAAIGKFNKIGRGKLGVTYGQSRLELGILTKITANHHVDLTRSIIIGDFSIIAGVRSQLWTHGYVHDEYGPGRFRVDGEIKIGHNVYIGSGVLINPGVSISDKINVGGNTTISKDLTKSGMYVNQPLRHLDKSYSSIMANLKKVEGFDLVEEVYEK